MSGSEDHSPHAPETPLQLERPEQHQNGGTFLPLPSRPPLDPNFLPGGSRALSGISRRAFLLGVTFGITSITTIQLAYFELSSWPAPCFIAILSLFHYLEFDTTAHYNPSDAKIASFLLSSNGSAYNIAHISALVEFCARTWLRSSQRQRPSWLDWPLELPRLLSTAPPMLPLIAGFILVAIGQGVRTAAMAEAGTSFNHIVQSRKQDDHVLVNSGVYRFFRHPSYFGFFWWGLGTQLLLGNHICFLAYAVILWRFFAARIAKEEQFLVNFFGQDYLRAKYTPYPSLLYISFNLSSPDVVHQHATLTSKRQKLNTTYRDLIICFHLIPIIFYTDLPTCVLRGTAANEDLFGRLQRRCSRSRLVGMIDHGKNEVDLWKNRGHCHPHRRNV